MCSSRPTIIDNQLQIGRNVPSTALSNISPALGVGAVCPVSINICPLNFFHAQRQTKVCGRKDKSLSIRVTIGL